MTNRINEGLRPPLPPTRLTSTLSSIAPNANASGGLFYKRSLMMTKLKLRTWVMNIHVILTLEQL